MPSTYHSARALASRRERQLLEAEYGDVFPELELKHRVSGDSYAASPVANPKSLLKKEDGLFLDVVDPALCFYNDTADPARWAAMLTKHPKAAQFTAVSHEAFREVPVTYLMCEQDQALLVEVQRMMVRRVEEAGVDTVLVEKYGGSLSMLETVVDVVKRAAAAAVAAAAA